MNQAGNIPKIREKREYSIIRVSKRYLSEELLLNIVLYIIVPIGRNIKRARVILNRVHLL